MNNKYIFITVIIIALLVGGAYSVGRYTQQKIIVQPPFPTFNKDSLGVYRVMGDRHLISKDKSVNVAITYVQIGFSERVYNLKINNTDSYYGDINYGADGEDGYFYNSDIETPMKYHRDDEDDTSYIIIENKKIILTDIPDNE